MTPDNLVDLLAAHQTIGKAPRQELEWIAEHGTLRHHEVGQVVSRHTEIVAGLYIILSGHMTIYANRGGELRKLLEWGEGEVSGVLPYSRSMYPPGDTIVDEPGEVVAVPREMLPQLIENCPEVTAILVHVMLDRARRFTSADLRDEKLISLGKLAAGLAHEINNPASAAVRDAKSMVAALAASEDAARALGGAGLNREQLAALDAVHIGCMVDAVNHPVSALEFADREDAITGWLEAHGADATLAGDLARTPMTLEALDRLARSIQGEALTASLRWIAGGCATRLLAANIERAATRIHALVVALKGFTHMDRAPVQEPVDIRNGLSDTVALLAGKAKGKSVDITLTVPPDIPPIRGIAVEINQIWMNLIDNAIDAAPSPGHVDVTAMPEEEYVTVGVVDDGPGIPLDIREKIFDPFFTTKPVGVGTGLGLDIVRRVVQWHNGGVDVDSKPGRTEFRVRLPIAGKN